MKRSGEVVLVLSQSDSQCEPGEAAMPERLGYKTALLIYTLTQTDGATIPNMLAAQQTTRKCMSANNKCKQFGNKCKNIYACDFKFIKFTFNKLHNFNTKNFLKYILFKNQYNVVLKKSQHRKHIIMRLLLASIY